jgi:membrane protein YdbS with pleckstrin-like domain
MSTQEKDKKTIWTELLQWLLALGGGFGLLSVTNVKIPLNIWWILVGSVILLVFIFHMIRIYNKVIEYFKNLKKDIKYIREHIPEKNARGKK